MGDRRRVRLDPLTENRKVKNKSWDMGDRTRVRLDPMTDQKLKGEHPFGFGPSTGSIGRVRKDDKLMSAKTLN